MVPKRSIFRDVIHLALVMVAAGCDPGAEPELPPESVVRAAAARALGCLTAMQRTNGSFYQGSDDDFADWETANVVLGAAPWLPSGDARLATARAYLAQEQRKDGTWAPGPRQEDLTCLETSAVAVAAMAAMKRLRLRKICSGVASRSGMSAQSGRKIRFAMAAFLFAELGPLVGAAISLN